MTDDARIRLYQLACEAAFLIATSNEPTVELARFGDHLADELAVGRANLVGSEGLREAFRDAMGYSVRVPDALGEREPSGRETVLHAPSPAAGQGAWGASAAVSPRLAREAAAANPASRSPSALSGRDGALPATDGAPNPVVASPSRPPNAPDDDPMVRRLHVIRRRR